MANYNKQFNFRNGVQVDNDNLVVSPTGLVGIGTTIPTEALDVRDGNASISGFATAASLYSRFLEVNGTAGVTTITFTDAIGAGVSISSGIITAADPSSGIVTYYGDARFLSGMPTSQWVDVDAGLGYISIYAQGNVGVGTVDPRFTFQVGGNADNTLVGFTSGVGINSTGDVFITGITTSNKFVGIGSDLTLLDADNITSGTLSNDRLPILLETKLPSSFTVTGVVNASRFEGDLNGSEIQAGLITATTRFTGDITGNVTGDVTGTASTALSLSGTPNVIVGVLTASAVSASTFIGGITGDVTGNLTGTATTATSLTSDAVVDIEQIKVGLATVDARIGIGTDFRTGVVEIGGSTSNTADLFINRAYDRTNSGITTTDNIPATIKLWSDFGPSTVTIGTSQSDTGANGQLRYGNRSSGSYSTPNSLDLINYGDGNINSYLQAGTIGIDTGSFYWHDKNDVILTLTYEGRLGIGITLPEVPLHVVGDTIFTGDGTFGGSVSIAGSLTPGSIVLPDDIVANVIGNVTGNVDSQSGISTFVDIKSSFIGINGGSKDNEVPEVLSINSPGSGRVFVDQAGNVGVGTTAILIQGINAQEQDALIRGVGIGTTRPKCAVDFSNADNVDILGANRDRIAYMIPPRVTTSQRNLLTNVDNAGVETGAFIYNKDLNKLQFWNGSSWETVTSS